MKLEEVLLNLGNFDQEATIYATEPWTRVSKALVEIELKDELIPPKARQAGMSYFLEISIAVEIRDGWIGNLRHTPSDEEICATLIYYAQFDA